MLTPFYFDAKEKIEKKFDLTDKEIETRAKDYQSIRAMKEYRDKFIPRWSEAVATYNIAASQQFDDISNYQLGTARMMIDQSVSMMTRSKPEFDYEPHTHSDYKLMILYKSAVENVLNQNDFQSQLRPFMLDNHIIGTGAWRVGLQMPMRYKRIEQFDGTIEEKIVRDFRKPKVFIQTISPFYTYRNPTVSSFSDVSTAGYTETMTRDQFVQRFILPKVAGKPKYKNADRLPVTTHYKVEHVFDEVQDFYRIYVVPFGHCRVNGEVVEEWGNYSSEIGVPIYDKPISLNRGKVKHNGIMETFSSGMNIEGRTPLCFSRFIDEYDANFRHSIYGKGIPSLISGPEGVMQALFNMTIDNMRLANTVPISFIPNNTIEGASLPNDGRPMYSGQFVDGDIRPQPLGTADIGGNQAMWQWNNDILRWLTGINHQQFGDDGSKTAFEYGIKIRQNNARAIDRLQQIEEDCFKRMGMLLLSAVLADLTVPEWEELTEKQVKDAATKIKAGEVPASDYDLKNKRKKRMEFVPVKGYKFREDFTTTKKRTLDYNSTNNTLIEDKKMPGEVSYVPCVEEYFLPDGDIEGILRFDVRVNSKTMLGDLKAQEMSGIQSFVAMATAVDPLLQKKISYDSIIEQAAELQGLDTNRLYLDNQEKSAMLKQANELLEKIDQPPEAFGQAGAGVQPQAQGMQPATPGLAGTPPNAGQPSVESGRTANPPNSLQGLSAGTL